MASRFQIFLRKRQNRSIIPPGVDLIDVTVQCNPLTGYSEYIPGTVDNTWYDFTNFIEGSEKLSIQWDKVNSGTSSNAQTNKDGSNYDKGISSDLMFFDSAYQFIYDWLLASECQILNAIEVKIVDLIAGGTYRIFEIKNDNIEWAPIDEPCQFHIKLREQDGSWHCIHKTFIWDNWQNWFEASNVFPHPCFLTCIEPRPRLIQSARMALAIFFHSISFSNAIKDGRKILNANRFVDAPLVQTYIRNIALKCGMLTDTIFDAGQDWENVCLYYPQAGFMHESDENAIASPYLYYHFENRWLITIAELLDKLKVVFAAEWYVTPNNTIVFKHTKDLISVIPIYDFTLSTSVPFYDLRYSFNGDKKPAYGRYEYQTDGSDLASQEISTLYNDIIDYDGPANNPMLEGDKSKNFEFAPTGFVRDGRAKDYMKLLINDGKLGALALLAIFNVALIVILALSPFALAILIGLNIAWAAALADKIHDLNNMFVDIPNDYTGAVRLTSEQVLTPRLILWDGVSKYRAKAVANSLPSPNTFYNTTSAAYNVKNNISQDNPLQQVYNYPLYFDGDFKENLFDKYHDEIDNPLKSKESHQDFKFSVELCDTMLQVFGVFENQYIVIGKVIKIETRDNYDVYGRIGNIAVDYGTEDGGRITIKGKILRRV